MQIAIYVIQNIPQHKTLGHHYMPIALLPTEERDASYSIFWFMLALNTLRFATVLTHPSTCFQPCRIPHLCDCLSI